MSSYHRNNRSFDRIDQDEVPESKHTIFVRGLPGFIKTDEVKDFFEDHVGPCSFDFIKISPDQLKLFVAVRFETREGAKECMKRYNESEVLGHPVELTWFKDIRRYVSYQQSQGVRPATVNRNRYDSSRNYSSGNRGYDRSRDEYRDDEYGKKKRASFSDRHSYSRSSSRSRSRPSHERSRTPGSRHSNKRSRSRSEASVSPNRERPVSPPAGPPPQAKRLAEGIEKGSTPPLPPSPAPVSAVVTRSTLKETEVQNARVSRSPSKSSSPEHKSRREKRDRKKKRKRSPSSSNDSSLETDRSSDELNEEELRKKILKKRQKTLREKMAEAEETHANGKTLGRWDEKEAIVVPRQESSVLQNTTLKFGLESNEDIPKRIVKDDTFGLQFKKQTSALSKPAGDSMKTFSSPVQPRSIKADMGRMDSTAKALFGSIDSKSEDVRPGASVSDSLFGFDVDELLGKRATAVPAPSSHLEDMSSHVGAGSLRGQQLKAGARNVLDELDEPVQSGLRLSSLTRQINAETERERKLARLPPTLVAKFALKKKQFDASLKADCETFAFVAKMLTEKDPGLDDRLRLALSEVVRDMEEKFTKKTDQYLDQLIEFLGTV